MDIRYNFNILPYVFVCMKVVSHNGQSEESVLCHVFKLKHPVIAKIIREDVSKKTGFLQKISAKKSLPLMNLQMTRLTLMKIMTILRVPLQVRGT